MNAGKVLAAGFAGRAQGADPCARRSRTHSSRCCRKRCAPGTAGWRYRRCRILDAEPVITARDLTCRFGDFTAVDRVSFTIERGEIFGFVGSNGCGKTTTMKMLTGLLPPSEGEALLFGQPLDAHDINSRRRVGYMSQSFSLYTELTVRQNLDLHARLFHLPARKATDPPRTIWSRRFGLADYLDQRTSDLPLGIRQRLSLAVAIVHEPEMLILDEPTSGVDPLARDRFWELLIDLSRNQGVTIFVSTHFMNEAERCDRISLMDSGRVLATDTPAESDQGARRRNAGGRLHRLSRRGRPGRAGLQPSADAVWQAAAFAPASLAPARARVQPAAPLRLHHPRNAGACCATPSASASRCSALRS